jgi:hypothetical protein
MCKDTEILDRVVKSDIANQRVVVEIKKTDVKRETFQETGIEDRDPDDDHQASE